MCGIAGIIPLSKDVTPEMILEVSKHLLLENMTRGRDASGFASWNTVTNKILICKQAEEAKTFITNLTLDHVRGPSMIHCRAKTRGDPSDFQNNHPMFGEKFCIVHNGMVHTMKNLEGYTYKGICDTEVLLSYIEKFGVRGAMPQIDGSAAVAIMSPSDKKFYLYRHTSPIAMTYFPGKAFVFSSLEYPLKKVASILKSEKMWGMFPMQTMADFEEGQLFTIDLVTNNVTVEIIDVSPKVVGTCPPAIVETAATKLQSPPC
jgi:glucosamine 6-phosphate synthetase-like amidotransferase/phosphosugar isomerase protein